MWITPIGNFILLAKVKYLANGAFVANKPEGKPLNSATTAAARMKILLASLIALSLLTQALVHGKTWTDKHGRQFEGKLESLSIDDVSIRRASDNRRFTISRAILSEADQDYLRGYETEKEVVEFTKKYPSTLDESIKLSRRRNIPAIILYKGKSSDSDYNSFVKKYLMNERLLKKLRTEQFSCL